VKTSEKTNHSGINLLSIVILSVGMTVTPVFGDIVYSGVQNMPLQGVAGTNQFWNIFLAGDPAAWDTLNLEIAQLASGGGANNIFPGAQVALASTLATFPVVTRFNSGDPFPSSPVFGSGSEILWGFGTAQTDGDFFAAMKLGTFGGGPQFTGWIHLKVQNSSNSCAAITVVDWAYSDQVGQTIAMGQKPASAGPASSTPPAGNTTCCPTSSCAPLDTVGPLTSNVEITPYPLAVNTSSSLAAAISDLTTGGSNIASAYYSINGTASSQMTLSSSDAVTVQASAFLPPFSQSSIYSVCVHGIDSAGNTGADACIPVPVYDPAGSFVTGGGQVASPAGADLLNPSAAGAATFAFVSKYLPGRNTPSGNLEFQFKEGNLSFKSISMDWLVVTGEPRAKFFGTGAINETNVCKFEVDAWAGSFGGNDAFGLKISSCTNGGDRYTLPASPLTKGNIIIHK